mmetsp:Transcript_47109/g.142656  ORF Transcript_47109/g.142656 Transcript_47109/m.142656 type:complete len:133 (-) Transcript_47109:59-457(-)
MQKFGSHLEQQDVKRQRILRVYFSLSKMKILRKRINFVIGQKIVSCSTDQRVEANNCTKKKDNFIPQLSLTDAAIMRHIIFGCNISLQRIFPFWNYFCAFIMITAMKLHHFSSTSKIWAQIMILDRIDNDHK